MDKVWGEVERGLDWVSTSNLTSTTPNQLSINPPITSQVVNPSSRVHDRDAQRGKESAQKNSSSRDFISPRPTTHRPGARVAPPTVGGRVVARHVARAIDIELFLRGLKL